MEICVQEGNGPWDLASGAETEGSGTRQSKGGLNRSYEDHQNYITLERRCRDVGPSIPSNQEYVGNFP